MLKMLLPPLNNFPLRLGHRPEVSSPVAFIDTKEGSNLAVPATGIIEWVQKA